jgi:hypothetical protein
VNFSLIIKSMMVTTIAMNIFTYEIIHKAMVDGDKELFSLPGTSCGKLKTKDKEDFNKIVT